MKIGYDRHSNPYLSASYLNYESKIKWNLYLQASSAGICGDEHSDKESGVLFKTKGLNFQSELNLKMKIPVTYGTKSNCKCTQKEFTVKKNKVVAFVLWGSATMFFSHFSGEQYLCLPFD